MPSLPIAQWQAALDRMDAALAAATKMLNRSEERWEMAFAPSAGDGEPPAQLARLDARLTEWQTRVTAAEALTAAVEAELAERAAAVGRWRESFAQWEASVQR